ncbi:tRNA (adenosine(37)-N6)-dimethylallyltransferase MiaA [Enterococcus lemanii]|uniref:tRNA dimethylallyltransferase n=1 Tax=Enterococcus lemanii TaxID=1159752 RepID=A0ABV9MVI5_9ENTE|nr:tRNA (adenosine(37)-N6)-dimethylallyltransferase MiaA [Enterococcus lemanii]MBM7709692.1 tRNA dimethylallyltransferase [Enterococcus lemanii]
MKKVIVIVGPTAVGKTALSIELAQKLNGEIINADSMQIYRGLDIGTAKATSEERQGIPHHLLDICEISEPYSVADFQTAARLLIDEITQRGKVPIVVGGTGLYVQALLYDYQLGANTEVSNTAIREKYTKMAQEKGKQWTWEYLKQVDPLAAQKIHPNNERKVIRALEVYELTGTSILTPEKEPKKLYDDFLIGLTTKRELLYDRINLRVKQMVETGLISEAEKTLAYPDAQASRGIGYKEFQPFFAGEMGLEEVIEDIQLHSRRYAKRQLTWFRNRMNPRWYDLLLDPSASQQLEKEIKKWLEEVGISG